MGSESPYQEQNFYLMLHDRKRLRHHSLINMSGGKLVHLCILKR
jgi:hypothetical protein